MRQDKRIYELVMVNFFLDVNCKSALLRLDQLDGDISQLQTLLTILDCSLKVKFHLEPLMSRRAAHIPGLDYFFDEYMAVPN